MSLSNKKQSNIAPKIIKNNSEILYEIDSNENANTKELSTIETNNKKQKAVYIPFPQEFNIKMILGSPAKIRATASRIIKAGARGDIPQTHVNSLIWQLRSLIYFDQMVAELTVTKRLEDLEKAIRIQDKMNRNNE
jgi:hypothetical protein